MQKYIAYKIKYWYYMIELKKEGCVDMKIQAVLIDGFKNLSNVNEFSPPIS